MKEAGALIRKFAGKGLRIATAESCTGGLIAASLTDVAGSSDVFERGFVAYSNEAKIELLGVPAALIDKHGAVSEEVAGAMSAGALAHSPADVAIAVTGIAGPGGGTAEKPVGLVYVAAAQRGGGQSVQRHLFDGGRESVRLSAVRAALALALSLVAS